MLTYEIPGFPTLFGTLDVEVVKKRLQATPMGMEVDQFMQSALPELLQADFTAGMETQLDQIADGRLPWEEYLIGWNREYFAPAISKALGGLPAVASGNGTQRTLGKSRTKCPGCHKPMVKVPSKKVSKGYFLKCDQGCQNGERDLVMFWNQRSKTWALPGTQAPGERKPAVLTEFPCPVCNAKLEQYFYTKDGQEKSMLRCSSPKARQDKKHKEAVYFQSKGAWWSPKYGNLEPAKV